MNEEFKTIKTNKKTQNNISGMYRCLIGKKSIVLDNYPSNKITKPKNDNRDYITLKFLNFNIDGYNCFINKLSEYKNYLFKGAHFSFDKEYNDCKFGYTMGHFTEQWSLNKDNKIIIHYFVNKHGKVAYHQIMLHDNDNKKELNIAGIEKLVTINSNIIETLIKPLLSIRKKHYSDFSKLVVEKDKQLKQAHKEIFLNINYNALEKNVNKYVEIAKDYKEAVNIVGDMAIDSSIEIVESMVTAVIDLYSEYNKNKSKNLKDESDESSKKLKNLENNSNEIENKSSKDGNNNSNESKNKSLKDEKKKNDEVKINNLLKKYDNIDKTNETNPIKTSQKYKILNDIRVLMFSTLGNKEIFQLCSDKIDKFNTQILQEFNYAIKNYQWNIIEELLPYINIHKIDCSKLINNAVTSLYRNTQTDKVMEVLREICLKSPSLSHEIIDRLAKIEKFSRDNKYFHYGNLLYFACLSDNFSMFQKLLNLGLSPNSIACIHHRNEITPIIDYVFQWNLYHENKKIKYLEELIKHGANFCYEKIKYKILDGKDIESINILKIYNQGLFNNKTSKIQQDNQDIISCSNKWMTPLMLFKEIEITPNEELSNLVKLISDKVDSTSICISLAEIVTKKNIPYVIKNYGSGMSVSIKDTVANTGYKTNSNGLSFEFFIKQNDVDALVIVMIQLVYILNNRDRSNFNDNLFNKDIKLMLNEYDNQEIFSYARSLYLGSMFNFATGKKLTLEHSCIFLAHFEDMYNTYKKDEKEAKFYLTNAISFIDNSSFCKKLQLTDTYIKLKQDLHKLFRGYIESGKNNELVSMLNTKLIDLNQENLFNSVTIAYKKFNIETIALLIMFGIKVDNINIDLCNSYLETASLCGLLNKAKEKVEKIDKKYLLEKYTCTLNEETINDNIKEYDELRKSLMNKIKNKAQKKTLKI